MSRRRLAGLLGLLALALLAAMLRLLIDRSPSGQVTLAWPPSQAVAELRWTAVLCGAIVGAALSISGVLLQVLLRNPLACPFVLGLSSGAGLGVMIALYVGYLLETRYEIAADFLQAGGSTGPALIGAFATLAIVYALGRRRGWLDPLSLVLVGVVISAICGALIFFLQHLVPLGLRGDLMVWMMGRVPELVGGWTVAIIGGFTLVALASSMMLGRAMDAATLGDDEARAVGLALGPLRTIMLLAAGALAAGSVALAGPIAFVGLICPHAARLVVGPRHTTLVLASSFAGIVLLVGSDAIRQALDFGAGRMPIGVFTAIVGGCTFIWLLRSGRGTV